jgi:hypothetical protein
MGFRIFLHILSAAALLNTVLSTPTCFPSGNIPDVASCATSANPYVRSVSSSGWGSMLQTGGLFPCTSSGCEILVDVGNSGNSFALFSVTLLSCHKFGITFGGWKVIASQIIRLAPSTFSPAQDSATVVFPLGSSPWQHTSRVCLKAAVLPITGGNCNSSVSLPNSSVQCLNS